MKNTQTSRCQGAGLSARICRLDVWRLGAAVLLLAAASAHAGTYAWNKATGKNSWNVNANWTATPAGFPNAVGDTANLNTLNITANVTNELGQAITIGILNIGDSNTDRTYRIGTNGVGQVLIFDNGAAAAQINQVRTTLGDTIAAPVQIKGALNIVNASSTTTPRTLTLTQPIYSGASSGTQTVTVAGVANTTISGAIGNGASGGTVALTKMGTPTLLLSTANTFTGGLNARAGALTGTAQASGSPFGSSANGITLGGADPLVANYLPVLTLTGLAGATTTSYGDLTLAGSFNSGALAMNAAAGGATTLQGVNLVRNSGASLVVAPRSATSLTVDEKVQFTGSGTALVNGILSPWLVVAGNTGNLGGDFASYGANGIQRCGYASSFNPSLTTQVVASAAATLAVPQQAYAVRLTANLNLNGNTLTLGDGTLGGLILLNNTTLSNSGAGNLAFGSGELLAYVDAANSATISAPLSGTGALRKFGTGTLALTYPGLHSGDVALQGGTMSLNPTADFSYAGRITGAGTLSKDGSRKLTLAGTNTVGALAVASNGGTLTLPAGAVFQVVAGPVSVASSATLRIADGAILTNNATASIGVNTSNAGVVITNGASWVMGSGGVNVGYGSTTVARDNTVTIIGVNATTGKRSTWNLGGSALTVGYSQDTSKYGDRNTIRVADGGLLTNAAAMYFASTQYGVNNALIVTNAGRVFSGATWLGGCSPEQNYGCGGTNNSITVTGAGSLLNLGGKVLIVGASSGGQGNKANWVRVSGAGAVLTNAALTVGSYCTSGGSDNYVIVSDGGRLYTTSAGGGVGFPANGANAVTERNYVRVTGAGSVWNAGGGFLWIGCGEQAFTRSNWLQVDQGGTVTNVGDFAVGRVWARNGDLNRLMVTNGGRLFTKGAVYVGYAQATSPYTASSNSAAVAGGAYGDSRWDLGGGLLRVGYNSKNGCKADANAVRVSAGGSIVNAGAVTVGSNAGGTANDNTLTVRTGGSLSATSVTVGSAAATTGNRLSLEGGTVTAGSLTVNAAATLAPVIGASGITAMTVSGTATFSAGSYIRPSAAAGVTPNGTYTVLTANSIVNSGLALDPAVDASRWSFAIDTTSTPKTLKVTYKTLGTKILVR